VDKLLLQQSSSTASASISSTESVFERCLTKSDVDLLEEKVKASNVFKGRVVSCYRLQHNCYEIKVNNLYFIAILLFGIKHICSFASNTTF
jgi:hypothetical protein